MSLLIEGNNGLDNAIKQAMSGSLYCLRMNGDDSCQSEIGEWVGSVPALWSLPWAEYHPSEEPWTRPNLNFYTIALFYLIFFSIPSSTYPAEDKDAPAPPRNLQLPAQGTSEPHCHPRVSY